MFRKQPNKDKRSAERRQKAAKLIEQNQEDIFDRWEQQVRRDIPAAKDQDKLLLWDHLAPYLVAITDLLRHSTTDTARQHRSSEDFDISPSETHGRLRATLPGYSVQQVIREYIVLRQVITDLIAQHDLLDESVLEIISAVNENAMIHAATQFTKSLAILREKAVSTLMHDIKSPLNVVAMTAALVRTQAKDQQTSMDMIVGNVKKVGRLVDELLDAVRLGAGQGLELQFTELDLRTALHEATEGAILAHPNRLDLLLPDEPAIGFFDASGIARAVENLVSNGLKYGDAREKVRVELRKEAQAYIISVHNWGEPIDDADWPELFVTFARSRNPAKNRLQKGWGLGLAYVKAVAEGHGGEVNVESSLDSGTTFQIVLPRKQTSP